MTPHDAEALRPADSGPRRKLACAVAVAALLASTAGPFATDTFAHGGGFLPPKSPAPPKDPTPPTPPPPPIKPPDSAPKPRPTTPPPRLGPPTTPPTTPTDPGVTPAGRFGGSPRPAPTTPSDPPPPPPPPPPTTPSDPAPPDDGPPTPGEPLPRSGGGRGRGADPASGRGRKGADTTDWRDWWSANAEALRSVRPRRVRVTTDSAFAGIGGGTSGSDRCEPPTRRQIETTVLPTLRAILAATNRKDADTIAATALALAKASDDPADAVRIAAALGDRNLAAMSREAAALALGCFRRTNPPPAFDGRFYDRLRATLFETIDDRSESHRLRCNAAFAIGLLGDQGVTVDDAFAKDGRLAIRGLWMRLERPDTDDDTAVALLVALSLQNPAGVPRAVIDGLRRLAANGDTGRRRRGSLPRAHAVLALARLGDRDAIPLVTSIVKASGQDPNVRRSAVIALGLLAPKLEGLGRESLAAVLVDHAKSGEPNTAGLSLIAAARLLAAEFADGRTSDAGLALTQRLVDAADRGTHAVRPFAAIAVGVALRPQGKALDDARFIDARERSLDKLRRVYADDGEDPVVRGAFAIALGIAADAKAGPLLAANVASRRGSPDVAGYSCAALGLLGDVPPASLAALRTALADRSSDTLRLEAARALGLLGDARAIPALVAELESGGSDTVLARAVVALGAIRDASAIAPLAALARKQGAPDSTRALAVAGLGLLADLEEIRSLSLLGIDSNYLAGTDALDEALSML